jgi:PhzF family phenazine biosynthesis protein
MLPLLVVDAFTSEPFRGNPAGVVFLPEPRTDDWMRAVAAEMKHAETAFVVTRPDGAYDLRWWTPEVEVDLCGHATLASAHALWESGRLDPGADAVFHTRSGELRAVSQPDGTITLDFPAAPPRPIDPPAGLFEALGIEPLPIVESSFFMLVELADATAVRAVTPHMDRLAAVETETVIVTARSDDDRYDIVCRIFGPRIGIPEDSVTGAAQCVLAPYWEDRLGTDLRVNQCSQRGGVLQVRLGGDRVAIAGRAVTVLRGDLLV